MTQNMENRHDEYNDIIDRLIATAAASYVASYVCGVRDRHHDNILVTNDGRLFNIDFAYILGEKLGGLDAAKIAIPEKFVKVLGQDKWTKFVEIAVICYSVLRRNYLELLDFSRLLFAFMNATEENDKYIEKSLSIHMEEAEALQDIRA